MRQFLRELTPRNIWLSHLELAEVDGTDCPPAVMAALVRGRNGISVWQVKDKEDGLRIVAANALTKNDIEETQCIVFSEEELNEIGVNIKQKSAETPVEKINTRHYDIVNASAVKIISISHLICKKIYNGEVWTYSRLNIEEQCLKHCSDIEFSRKKFWQMQKSADFKLFRYWYERKTIDVIMG